MVEWRARRWDLGRLGAALLVGLALAGCAANGGGSPSPGEAESAAPRSCAASTLDDGAVCSEDGWTIREADDGERAAAKAILLRQRPGANVLDLMGYPAYEDPRTFYFVSASSSSRACWTNFIGIRLEDQSAQGHLLTIVHRMGDPSGRGENFACNADLNLVWFAVHAIGAVTMDQVRTVSVQDEDDGFERSWTSADWSDLDSIRIETR